MSEDEQQQQPIIIKKIYKSHGGHHGGAWKVAFADFMTAMMAFFLVLWLVGQDQEIKDSVAGYFQDPVGFDRGGKMGAGKGAGLLNGQTGIMDKKMASSVIRKMMKEAAESIMQNLMLTDEFKGVKNNVHVELTAEGLRIQIIEGADSAFFESGSSRMSPTGEAVLALIAQEITRLPNRIIFEGHTDASGASNQYGYSNWDLAADRANYSRKIMLKNGIRPSQVKEVRSYASTQLLFPDRPQDPQNRRVSILVLNDYDYVLEHNLLDTSYLGSIGATDNHTDDKHSDHDQTELAKSESGETESGETESGETEPGATSKSASKDASDHSQKNKHDSKSDSKHDTEKKSEHKSKAKTKAKSDETNHDSEEIDEDSFELPDYLKDTTGTN